MPSPAREGLRGGGTPPPPEGRARCGPACRSPRCKDGFALLIVVTLLSFLVLLLVGLAAYTRIETAVAGNNQRQAQARENALLALNVALGQLQKHAGSDRRVTATAANFGGINGTRHYTGVWPSDPALGPGSTTPATWLVSGNEFTQPDTSEGAAEGATIPAPLAIVPAASPPRPIDLVARNSTGTTSRTNTVAAPLVDLRAPGVPGAVAGTDTVIGRYAWWVGDQGVKAPVAVPDSSTGVNFAPYDSADLRSRIRQQLTLGAAGADANGNLVFEPRDNNNSGLVAGQKVVAASQIAFLRNSANAQLGLTRVQQNFHTWSPNNFAVIADTKNGGLKQDLSLAPGLLGGAFAAWANYPAYMEAPVATPVAAEGETVTPPTPVEGEEGTAPVSTLPRILPDYGSDPLRRRYVMQGVAAPQRIAPVLSFFGLSFSVRNNTANTDLEVSARCVVGLWNPYTAALVPEDLQIVVKGLPARVSVHDSTSELDGTHVHVNLAEAMKDQVGGGELKFLLPFTPDAVHEDRSSWLPGRVYNWSAASNTSDPADGRGKPMAFYARAAAQTGHGVVRLAGPALPASDSKGTVYRWCTVTQETRLRIELLRAATGEKLAEFNSPPFSEFETPKDLLKTEDGFLDFAYIFRLPSGLEIPTGEAARWLEAAGRDPRQSPFPARGYVGPGFGLAADGRIDPWLLIQIKKSTFDASYPDLVLDRPTDELSYEKDVPLFELPRSPLLSLGALQHLPLPGQRPFMIGNPWGADYQLNGIRLVELFDRFTFSGLVEGMTPATATNGDLILPNPQLKPVRFWDRSLEVPIYRRPTIKDVRDLMNPPTTTDADGNTVSTAAPSAVSARFFLQGGAFNLNSSSAAAWASVLRGVRFPSQPTSVPQRGAFAYLNLSTSTGTAADTSVATVQSNDAQFFRFSQSAQETYKPDGPPPVPVEGAEVVVVTPPNRQQFRQGMRTLTATQVGALAAKIAGFVAAKHAADGPFRSLEEFLSPNALYAPVVPVDPEAPEGTEPTVASPRSLLEAAIADAGVNSDLAEFSSQWLTQADLLTALAPVLFPRSDTFVIRTYGEVVNPATDAVEGRSWCEAIVQRVPEYLDPKADAPDVPPGALASVLNQVNGRRFKVVSFRWLTRADI